MKNEHIPRIVIARLPIYIQTLNQLLRENKTVICSMELGKILGITPSQIRKDLSRFGGFGKQGTGYDIVSLMESLREILNLNQIWQIVLVGVGHIGQALLNYDGFGRKGFEIVAAYDNSARVIGKKIGGIEIQSVDKMEEQVCSDRFDIAAIAVPAEQAQEVCDQLVKCGIKAILNYAPVALNVPEDVHVSMVDPVLELQKMTYYLK